jgi:hypothetical protein
MCIASEILKDVIFIAARRVAPCRRGIEIENSPIRIRDENCRRPNNIVHAKFTREINVAVLLSDINIGHFIVATQKALKAGFFKMRRQSPAIMTPIGPENKQSKLALFFRSHQRMIYINFGISLFIVRTRLIMAALCALWSLSAAIAVVVQAERQSARAITRYFIAFA